MTDDMIKQVAQAIADSHNVVAFTGAGISVESGIPAFRGGQGLWDKYDPIEYAHINSFLHDPEKVWQMLKEMDDYIQKAKPNVAHNFLSYLEKKNHLKGVITQNVDNLHQRAGSQKVIEFHGNSNRLRCLSCGRVFSRDKISLEEIPPRCTCKSRLVKPDVVFFGEPIPSAAHEEALELARQCEIMIVIGTSALVAPASTIPYLAKHSGAIVIEINLEPTSLTKTISDFFLQGSAVEVTSLLWKEMDNIDHKE